MPPFRPALYSLLSTSYLLALGGNDSLKETSSQIILDPSRTYQQMVGFGGGLMWHNDRIIRRSNTDEIPQLPFEDLGTDIILLQNW